MEGASVHDDPRAARIDFPPPAAYSRVMRIMSIPRLAAAAACLAAALSSPLPAEDSAPADLPGRVEAALRRLDDDAFATRAAAIEELVALGSGAVPLLEKRLDGLSAEARGGTRAAIRRILSNEALARVLPPLKRVTLDLKDRPVKEALAEVQARTGLPLDFKKLPDEPAVTLSIRDALPLQALDEICRKAGGIAYQVHRRSRARKDKPEGVFLRFQAGDPPGGPAVYVRHYRFSVTDVSMTKSLSIPGSGERSAYLQIAVLWPPNVKPDGMSDLVLNVLEDQKGRSLIEEDPDARPPDVQWSYDDLSDSGEQSRHVTFRYPDADAGAIRILKGMMAFRYPTEARVLRIPKPAESVGTLVETPDFTVTLKEFQRTKKTVTLDLEVAWSGTSDRDGSSSSGAGAPFPDEAIELVTAGGAVYRKTRMSGGGGEAGYSYQLTYQSDNPEEVTEIRIPYAVGHIEDEVKFEIRDIPLPD